MSTSRRSRGAGRRRNNKIGVIASEAKQSQPSMVCGPGLLRLARNDGGESFDHSTFTFASLITLPHFA
jgi:hypothetical protein